MTKKPYKVMALSALITVMAAGSIMPTYASAAESTAKSTPIHAKTGTTGDYPDYSLGPEGLKEAITNTGSNALVMDLYALTIIKQANADFNGLNSIDTSLRTKIINDQNIARINAGQWLDKLKPQMISTNQNIINYNTKFQNYYDTLITAVNNKDKETLSNGLTRLNNDVVANKAEVDELLGELREFRKKMATDTQNFKQDATQITSILASQDAGIPLLQNQLTTYHATIAEYNKLLIASAVATALGPLAIIGGAVLIGTGLGAKLGVVFIVGGLGSTAGGIAGIVIAKQEMDKAQEEIMNITGQITQAQLEVAGLTNLKEQTESLTETIDIAITALQNLSTKWDVVGSKYKSLLKNIAVMDPNDLFFIKEDLDVAKDSWKEVRDTAANLYETDIKLVDTK
ncbi:enterotoxin [Bacillus thuringiensis]|uniref:non-hemolytic enterotoxin subunit B n=1 Tax=Bacillus thuringiensis TaxID=1428 RepID=UPI000BEC5C10|nr:HBL/NHE enterotoxin family protein [Bacillus thuringiensis]PDY96914.1 enterotoxin [Bacillus thuringiensis]PGV50575.1 enterotoxin [Bacillus thuringiensis]